MVLSMGGAMPKEGIVVAAVPVVDGIVNAGIPIIDGAIIAAMRCDCIHAAWAIIACCWKAITPSMLVGIALLASGDDVPLVCDVDDSVPSVAASTNACWSSSSMAEPVRLVLITCRTNSCVLTCVRGPSKARHLSHVPFVTCSPHGR